MSLFDLLHLSSTGEAGRGHAILTVMSSPEPASPQDFYALSRPALEQWCVEQGLPAYRARQVFSNVYRRGVPDFAAMTDLAKPLRASLTAGFDLTGPRLIDEQVGAGEEAVKFLWRLADGREIESVFMTADYRETICFSTQVGCAFGCSFCVTARMKRLRNLTPGEIVGQIYHLARTRRKKERGVNLVAMGMGEPMDNLDALLEAVGIVTDPMGLNISPQRITVSTVGLVPGIERLAKDGAGLKLALSLNATTDQVRGKLMPVNRKYPLDVLLPAVEAFARITRSRVTLEYVLIEGLNDTPEDAERLGRIAARFPSKVNIIPFNPSDLFFYRRPSPQAVNAFARAVWGHKTTVTVRYSKGVDILAACGQLGYGQVKDKLAARA